MAKNPVILLPRLQQLLTQTGEQIRLARLRRKLSAARVAERAAISRNTLLAIEQGASTVSMGAYLQVLFVLGLEKTILLLAADDVLKRFACCPACDSLAKRFVLRFGEHVFRMGDDERSVSASRELKKRRCLPDSVRYGGVLQDLCTPPD